MLPREARRQVPVPRSQAQITYSELRVFLPSAASRGVRGAGAGSRDSGLPLPRLVRKPPALLLNYPAARAVRPHRAPPPRERPSPALGERAARLCRLGRQTQRHRRQCAGADAAEAVRREAAPRSPARALQGPEEVCWPGTKHAAVAGHACSF